MTSSCGVHRLPPARRWSGPWRTSLVCSRSTPVTPSTSRRYPTHATAISSNGENWCRVVCASDTHCHGHFVDIASMLFCLYHACIVFLMLFLNWCNFITSQRNNMHGASKWQDKTFGKCDIVRLKHDEASIESL